MSTSGERCFPVVSGSTIRLAASLNGIPKLPLGSKRTEALTAGL
jgi:hypothetical protein